MADEDLDQLGVSDDETRQKYPLIARPAPAGQPVAVRGLTPPAASSAPAEPAAPALPMTPASATPKLPPEKPAIPASPLQRQTEQDRSTQQRLDKGSGISQIGNPWARGALRGLNIAGEIGSAVMPQIGTALRAIPGTEEHHQQLVRQNQGAIGQDVAQAKEGAQTGLEEVQAGAIPSEVALREAQTAAAGEPKPKEEKWDTFAGFTDTDGTPLMREENSGQVVRASDKKPPTGFKAAAAQKPEKPDTPEQQFLDQETAKGIPLAQAIADYAKASQRPERSGAGDARGERSYQATLNRVDKLRAPVEQRLERISRLEDTLNQNSPQADALIAPELLTVMAGGQGSGLRMNEAEISRIVGGRTQWQSLKAKIDAWQLDPSKPFALTPEQRKEVRALFTTVKDRVSKKAQAIDEAGQQLADSDDPKEHRQIYQRLQKSLLDIDSGAGAGQGTAGHGGGAEGEAKPVYVGGKLVGHTTDGKTMTPVQP